MTSSARLVDCPFARCGIARLASPADAACRNSLRLILILSCSCTKTVRAPRRGLPGARSRPNLGLTADVSASEAMEYRRRTGRSLQLDLGLVNHLGPPVGVRHDEALEIARRHRPRHAAKVRE